MTIAANEAACLDPEEEQAFLDAIERWVQKEVRPVVMEHDHGDIWPEKLVGQMAEMGLFGATIGKEYGGLGLPATTYAKIIAYISSYWMAITGIVNSHLIMAAAVERFGTEEQKQKWLPRFATGEIRGGLALTEPNAGTDLQAIRTVARREGDELHNVDRRQSARPELRRAPVLEAQPCVIRGWENLLTQFIVGPPRPAVGVLRDHAARGFHPSISVALEKKQFHVTAVDDLLLGRQTLQPLCHLWGEFVENLVECQNPAVVRSIDEVRGQRGFHGASFNRRLVIAPNRGVVTIH